MSYLRKIMFKEIPLSHSLAVAKADNTVDPLFEKGMPLPLKKMKPYIQTVAVKKDDPQSEINIPLVEGSNELADRNILIGRMIIPSGEVKRDIPGGSNIDFTLTVDQSNRLTGIVYVDILDQEFTKAIELIRPEVDKNKILADARAEIRRFHAIEEQVQEVKSEKAKAALQRIKTEKVVEEVESAMDLIDNGGDAEDMLLNRLRGLRLGLDEVQSVLAWPVLVKEAEKNKNDVEKLIKDSKHADVDDKTLLSHLLKEYDHALQEENTDLLRRVSSEFDDLYYTVARKDPGYWVAIFENLRSSRNNMTDQGLVNDLFAQGHRSIDSGDVDGLRSSVRQLVRLLPREEAAKIPGFGGTVQ
jgi:molecular chaperone DnaK